MASSFASSLASKTEAEFLNYNGHHETTTKMSARIKTYWKKTVGGFTSVAVPWSGVFTSFMLENAGATNADFNFSARHAIFVKWAIENADNSTGLFRAYAVTSYAPKIGDIIHNNRGGTLSYAYARAHDNYNSHSAIVVEEGSDGSGRYVRAIGGNEGNTVGDTIIRVNASGLIKQPAADPTRYICVIQNLK